MTFNPKDRKEVWIQVGVLRVVWTEAQRAYNLARVKQIVQDFDPDQFGQITVCPVEGKKDIYHIVDGQKRVSAIKMMWDDDKQCVPCKITKARTKKEAAENFLGINSGESVSSIDRFLCAVTAEHTTETAVNKIINEMGWTVGRSNSSRPEGILRAVGACVGIYNQHGGPMLKEVLFMTLGTFGRQYASTDSTILRGFAILLARHPTLNTGDLVAKAKKEFGHPGALINAAQNIHHTLHKSMPESAAFVLLDTYNRGRKKNRLELVA